jgi:DNA-binding NtrC family response regulator
MPVIICTGHSSLISEEKAREAGFAAYIMKPISKGNIADTLRTVLDKKKNKN